VESLRRGVLAGVGWRLGDHRDRALLDPFLADLHEAAGAQRQVVAIRDWEVFETAARPDAADALWFPLLGRDAPLGRLVPAASRARKAHLGGASWVP
jgi:hypothetical protein